ncbi:DUF4062 domain-containing protein [Paraburkholderia dipogonis]|uniref:DUF4062 domain-containing protein n=1 Tax=Paraburkholderia dipogonis TaxID=1211383 RepID=UPI0038BA7EBF
MDKKYQVFISSTYTDMKAERRVAVEAILDAGHIPAGMELFAASDRSQMEVIRAWIDKSDIFMLILGGRYGSIDPESGKSYIQLEYEHAVATEKPFFAIYLTDEAINNKVKELGTAAIEQNDTMKLNQFRALVKSKLCSEVSDARDIHRHVQKSINHLAEGRKLEGWVRASSLPDFSPQMEKMGALQTENAHLKHLLGQERKEGDEIRHLWLEAKAQAAKAVAANPEVASPLRFTGNFSKSTLNEPLELVVALSGKGGDIQNVRWKGTYLQLFSMIGFELIRDPSDEFVGRTIFRLVREHDDLVGVIERHSYNLMRNRFVELGVIEPLSKGSGWLLTNNGKALLMKIHEENGNALLRKIQGHS